MMFQSPICLALVVMCLHLASTPCVGQTQPVWDIQKSGVTVSLRGLCVVDADSVWVSGAEGTVIRTADAGETWLDVSIREASELDFRDVHAWDDQHAVALSAGQPARVYRTDDGGRTWSQQYQHASEESFFDSLAFWDVQHGIAMSDPIDGRVLFLVTSDGGGTWRELPVANRPRTLPGEAGFAASGSNMTIYKNRVFVALGGGLPEQDEVESRVVYSDDRGKTWQASIVPMRRGPSRGIFSVHFASQQKGVCVGGDYQKESDDRDNLAVTHDGGKTWSRPAGKSPQGFRSCVTSQTRDGQTIWVCVGPSGTDVSDDGSGWRLVSEVGFHAVEFSPDGASGFACGSDGRVAKWRAKQPAVLSEPGTSKRP